jgi:hypothetical protein
MAYQRYSRQSEWYIFWEATDAASRDEELLAVWHTDHRSDGATITYRDAREMLATGDFGRIPGFLNRHHDLMREALEEFVADVDDKYEQPAS